MQRRHSFGPNEHEPAPIEATGAFLPDGSDANESEGKGAAVGEATGDFGPAAPVKPVKPVPPRRPV